jgi:TolA-binding protein
MSETKQSTNGAPAVASSKARERAAAASITLAVAQARDRRAAAAASYEEQTKGLLFTKDFGTALEAIMRDELATVGQRFLAWLKRYSWGEYSLYRHWRRRFS